MNQCAELGELAIMCHSHKCSLSVQLLFNNGCEVANVAHNMALFVHFKGQSSMLQNNKFGAHSHLPGNGLYSICSLMVLMVPRSHTLLRLQHQQVPAYLYQTTFFGFATSCPKL